MSKFWRGPARNDPTYKRARAFVLQRARWRCEIRGPRCKGTATQAHHMDGVTALNLYDVKRMQASCGPCNAQIGRPKHDPPPRRAAWL